MNNEIQVKKIYDKYEITSDGRVFSLIGNRKQLKTNISSNGYYKVDIWINKKRFTKRIHRLVAEAFMSNPNNCKQVNHKDGNKQNNNLENLEWCTPRQNNIHARDAGLTPKTCKITIEIAEEIRKLHKTKKYTQREIGKMFNIHQSSIGCVVNNKRWIK